MKYNVLGGVRKRLRVRLGPCCEDCREDCSLRERLKKREKLPWVLLWMDNIKYFVGEEKSVQISAFTFIMSVYPLQAVRVSRASIILSTS